METLGLLSRWENPGVALVTGASSGIGAEFARQLAAYGFTPVLVARREERLKALAEELHQASGVSAEVLVADLATTEGISLVETRIKKIENLDVLVNDAGFGLEGKFFDVDLGPQIDMLRVHVLATIHFCHAAINMMKPRRRGAIINVSSIAAFGLKALAVFNPTGGLCGAMYNSTKAFLNAFSENLAFDLHGKKIKVQALCPGYTDTEIFYVANNRTQEFIEAARARLMKYCAENPPPGGWMTPKECVSESLANLGQGGVIFIPGVHNRELLANNGIKMD